MIALSLLQVKRITVVICVGGGTVAVIEKKVNCVKNLLIGK